MAFLSPRLAGRVPSLVARSSVSLLSVPTSPRPFSSTPLRNSDPPTGNALTNRKMRMIILGAPGAGKGTLSDWLLDKYDIESVVVGQLLRQEILNGTELGKEAESTMKRGGLLSDEVVLQVVEPALKAMGDKNWLLDGFPRKASQAVALDSLLLKLGSGKPDEELNFVAALKVPDEVIVKRIADRYIHLPSGRTYNLKFNPPLRPGLDDLTSEPLSQRPDDNPTTVQRRLKIFHEENDPLLAHYGRHVSVFEGETSKAIWPEFERRVLASFPGLKKRTTLREAS